MSYARESLNRAERYPLSSKYDPGWVVGLDMGPNPLWQLEDLLSDLRLQPGQKVLDLGWEGSDFGVPREGVRRRRRRI